MKAILLLSILLVSVFSACSTPSGDAGYALEDSPMGIDIKKPRPPTTPPASTSLQIPRQSDWEDHGIIFSNGAEGEWDNILWGGFAASAVKKDNTYYLYYQGSDGWSDELGSVVHRQIGLATSSNGISFTKHPSSPVIEWQPSPDPNGLEEGAASGGLWLEDDNTISAYYGANTFAAADQVFADGRLATSSDGISFTDQALVLDHTDNNLWGANHLTDIYDELFPIMGFEEEGKYYLYYLPNNPGPNAQGKLGVAWGPSKTQLTNSAQVTVDGADVINWGPAGWARKPDGTYIVFLSINNKPDIHGSFAHMDVYTVNPDSPSEFSGPVTTYALNELGIVGGTVLLDLSTNTWFMYYRKAGGLGYGVMTAPVTYS